MSFGGRDRVEGKRYRVCQPKVPEHRRCEAAKTKQEPKADADINNIMARVMKGMPATHLNPNAPRYGDFSQEPNLMEAYDVVLKAQESFDALPAAVRRELGNDPRALFNPQIASKEFFARHGLLKPESAPIIDPSADTRALTEALKEQTKVLKSRERASRRVNVGEDEHDDT